MKPLRTPWTKTELATAVAMRQAGNTISQVAKALDREFGPVASKIGNLKSLIDGPRLMPARPERRRREYASRAELVTSIIMGDPAPGRSALDQRQT